MQGDAAWAEVALREGRTAEVIARLAPLERDARLERLYGVALRAEQRVIEGDAALARAHAMAPENPLALLLHAQSRFELGHPAAHLFAQARARLPANPEVIRNEALALAAEGRVDDGIAMLARALDAEPGWIDGHRALASLRWTHGRADPFAGYARAVAAQPANGALWMAWFGALAQQRDWPAARTVLASAIAALGETRPLRLAAVLVAVESGERDAARALLAETGAEDDPGLSLCRIRFALRDGDPAAARDEAMAMLAGAAATLAWPYLGLAWRMLGDPAADWLEGDPRFVGEYEVGLTPDDLTALASTLRPLHVASAPYADQSVRGGTQTDRSVLLRHEPILQRARVALTAAVETHVAALPPPDPRHPLLGRPRAPLRIAGSWSVRLTGGGRNVAHTHPRGWLSSAFYVSLPDPVPGDPPDAGWLALGTPPPELGLGLRPTRTIAPATGRLVLFPSTMWHSTLDFAAGERLNIAFDMVPAAG